MFGWFDAGKAESASVPGIAPAGLPCCCDQAGVAKAVRRNAVASRRFMSISAWLRASHVSDQILFLVVGQLQAENQIEELDAVRERQQPTVMHIGR
jgi:hypothetical protein